MLSRTTLIIFAIVLVHPAWARQPISIDLHSYSFEQYVKDFGKEYASPDEYESRKSIFAINLDTILKHNDETQAAHGGHMLGINQFADTTANEMPLGFDKSTSWATLARPPQNISLSAQRSLSSLPMSIDDVKDLPREVDWRKLGVVTPVKNQGMCGSCWAFASAAVLESHIALQTNVLMELSEQQLLSCASNPMWCGGTGGCTGATAEIAFEHVKQHGIVSEWSFGYQSGHGANVSCPLSQQSHSSILRNDVSGSELYKESVATISGYVSLESNNYQVLMNAVAKLGPVTVSVAAHPWMLYQSGVLDVPFNATGATDIDHLVVLEGYGTDGISGEDFWLVRNSWGPLWGEGGYIRLKRVDPNTLGNPDDACGIDVTPADGDACSKDKNGHEITPPAVKVCGNSGILYGGVVLIGGHLL
jgi:cathepsin L